MQERPSDVTIDSNNTNERCNGMKEDIKRLQVHDGQNDNTLNNTLLKIKKSLEFLPFINTHEKYNVSSKHSTSKTKTNLEVKYGPSVYLAQSVGGNASSAHKDSSDKKQDDTAHDYLSLIDVAGFSYRRTSLFGNKFIFSHKEMYKYPFLLKLLTQSSFANSSQRIYKTALIFRRSSYSKGSEQIVWYYPKDESEEDVALYKPFCFPELVTGDFSELIIEEQSYYFTRTKNDGTSEFGYCLRIFDERLLPVVICLISKFPAYRFYNAILHQLEQTFHENKNDCITQSQILYNKPIPEIGSPVVFTLRKGFTFYYCWTSDDNRIIENYSILFKTLSVENIVKVFASLFRSRSLICFSKSLSLLSRCVQAFYALLYPFQWPFLFSTIVPTLWANDVCEVPTPYIYGFLYPMLPVINHKPLEKTLMMDLDYDSLKNESGDETEILPQKLQTELINNLKYVNRFRIHSHDENVTSFVISEAFIKFFAQLLHKLPSIVTSLSAESNLDREHLASKLIEACEDSGNLPFLNELTKTMLFSRFVEETDWKTATNSKFFRRLREYSHYSSEQLSFEYFKQQIDEFEKQCKLLRLK